jgi:hypothetical protein
MSSHPRRRPAILAADVAGYSKLAGADENRTLARLCAYQRSGWVYGVKASLPVSLSRCAMAGSGCRRLGHLCRLTSLQAKRPNPSRVSYLVVYHTDSSIRIKWLVRLPPQCGYVPMKIVNHLTLLMPGCLA